MDIFFQLTALAILIGQYMIVTILFHMFGLGACGSLIAAPGAGSRCTTLRCARNLDPMFATIHCILIVFADDCR